MMIHFNHSMGWAARRMLIAGLCCSALSAQAFELQGTLTGATVSPTEIQAGQPIKITVQGTMKPGSKGCEIYAGLNLNPDGNAANTVKLVGVINAFPATLEQTVTIVNKDPGTYQIRVYPGAGNPERACNGSVMVPVKVVAPFKLVPAMPIKPAQALACPQGYDSSESNPQTGAIKCTKHAAQCPSGYSGGQNPATGKLECTPIAHPELPCPESTPSNKWGSSYFKDGWRVMGCSVNLAPPK